MDIICLGEALIDLVAVQSGVQFREVSEFKRVAGGAPANVSVGVSRLGGKSAFIGRVGRDEFGFYLRDILSDNGVNIDMLQYDDEARTALAFIALPEPTRRKFLFYRNPSADMRIDSGQFDANSIKRAKIFHFGSITLISEPSRTSTLDAAKIAKDSGALISYDPNLRMNLWPDKASAKKQIMSVMPMADIVKLNDEELEFLTGRADMIKGSASILSTGPKIVLVTLGHKGAFYATAKFRGSVDTYDVKTVDSTGCGDSFVSCFLKFLTDGSFDDIVDNDSEILKAVKISNAAASLTSMKKGVIDSLPYDAQLREFLKKIGL